MIFYSIVIIYIVSAILTVLGIDTGAKRTKKEGDFILTTMKKIIPLIPGLNTLVALVTIYLFTLEFIGTIELCYLKISMRIAKGAKKIKIGRKIHEKFESID